MDSILETLENLMGGDYAPLIALAAVAVMTTYYRNPTQPPQPPPVDTRSSVSGPTLRKRNGVTWLASRHFFREPWETDQPPDAAGSKDPNSCDQTAQTWERKGSNYIKALELFGTDETAPKESKLDNQSPVREVNGDVLYNETYNKAPDGEGTEEETSSGGSPEDNNPGGSSLGSQDDLDANVSANRQGEDVQEFVIDTELDVFQSARPRVSAYVPEGEGYLRKAGSWLGLPEPHSPLEVLRKASRLEWALFDTLPDVTKTGVRSFGDEVTERVKPSRKAELDRRSAFTHLDSLDWHEVLHGNLERLGTDEFSGLEESIMAWEGNISPMKPPRKSVSERTSRTPREKFTEGKRQRSNLMFPLNSDRFDGRPMLLPPPEYYSSWTKEVMAAPPDERLKMIQKRDQENRSKWTSKDAKYKMASKRLGLLREIQTERTEAVQNTLEREKGELFSAMIEAENVVNFVAKHNEFLADAYCEALRRKSLENDTIRYWEKLGTGEEMSHFPKHLQELIRQDSLERKDRRQHV
ncbi:hypothetical protein SUNI508_06224 [Seiridium unicorne]|uniref:Uncharacterized protein n=1 Tax=Seiridium unicorne TaxID=138068 RepID=A0ABR2V3B4_9PEZI